MPELPYVVLSCAMSLDGFLDDGSDERLMLSGPADLDRVDELRSNCDAILVGATTIRHDDPRLLVTSPDRIAHRRAAGMGEQPIKVTLTQRAKLDPTSRFFTLGTAPRLVYCASDTVEMARGQLGDVARVIDAGRPVDLRTVCTDLTERGVRRLLVEGGGEVHTQFLTEDLVDELQLVVAPIFVGRAEATRFVGPGSFPTSAGNRARLLETRPVGDVVLLRFALSARAARRRVEKPVAVPCRNSRLVFDVRARRPPNSGAPHT